MKEFAAGRAFAAGDPCPGGPGAGYIWALSFMSPLKALKALEAFGNVRRAIRWRGLIYRAMSRSFLLASPRTSEPTRRSPEPDR